MASKYENLPYTQSILNRVIEEIEFVDPPTISTNAEFSAGAKYIKDKILEVVKNIEL